MTYVIVEGCIGVKDRACVDVCPVDCIYEGEDQLYIHPDECIDCGACEPECPVTAIFPEEDVPPQWVTFVEKNREVVPRSFGAHHCTRGAVADAIGHHVRGGRQQRLVGHPLRDEGSPGARIRLVGVVVIGSLAVHLQERKEDSAQVVPEGCHESRFTVVSRLSTMPSRAVRLTPLCTRELRTCSPSNRFCEAP